MIRTRGASGNDPEACCRADRLRHSPVSGFPVTKLECEKESSKSVYYALSRRNMFIFSNS